MRATKDFSMDLLSAMAQKAEADLAAKRLGAQRSTLLFFSVFAVPILWGMLAKSDRLHDAPAGLLACLAWAAVAGLLQMKDWRARNRTRKAFESNPPEIQERVGRLLEALKADGFDLLVRESDQTPQLPCRVLLTDDGALVGVQDTFHLLPPRALFPDKGLEITLENRMLRGTLGPDEYEAVKSWKTRLEGLQAAREEEQWWT